MLLLWLVGITLLLLLLYFAITAYKHRNFYESQGIPFLGYGIVRFLRILLNEIDIPKSLQLMYDPLRSQNQRFGVAIDFGKPTFVIADTDIVKRILVKDFDHFVDRRKFETGKDDLLGRMLLAVEGDHWKALRGKMSPTFTTGKIRRMFGIFDKSGNRMVTFVKKMMGQDGVVDLKEAYSKYTMDVIAGAAFGIDSKAFDSKEPSVFETMGSKLSFTFNLKGVCKFFVMLISPKLATFLGVTFFDSGSQNFFRTAIKSTINSRESEDIKRDDFIQLMLEARHGQLKVDETELNDFEKEALIAETPNNNSSTVKASLEDEDIVAQSVLFILGGFDTTQSLLMFVGYNLAIFPEHQVRLFEEVKQVVDSNEGKFTYESVNNMPFMDMFINETLRFYPPGIAIERTCTKDYKIPNSDVTIKKGNMILVPVFSMQRDSKYFPDPDKFDPERFSAKNKASIPTYAFAPFGHGPRNCIGMRFALTEVKIPIAQLVLNFVLEPSEKTPIPVKFSKSGALKPEGGLWLKLKPRN